MRIRLNYFSCDKFFYHACFISDHIELVDEHIHVYVGDTGYYFESAQKYTLSYFDGILRDLVRLGYFDFAFSEHDFFMKDITNDSKDWGLI